MNVDRLRSMQGFTLLEALVAFTLLAVILVVAFEVFSGGVRRIDVAERYSVATVHAENLLARLGADIPVETGTKKGVFEDGYKWRLEISPFKSTDGSEHDLAMSARAIVSWPDGDSERDVTLYSVRLRKSQQ